MANRNIVHLDGTIEERSRGSCFGVRTSEGVLLATVGGRLHRSADLIRVGDQVRVRFDTEDPVAAVIVEHLQVAGLETET